MDRNRASTGGKFGRGCRPHKLFTASFFSKRKIVLGS